MLLLDVFVFFWGGMNCFVVVYSSLGVFDQLGVVMIITCFVGCIVVAVCLYVFVCFRRLGLYGIACCCCLLFFCVVGGV